MAGIPRSTTSVEVQIGDGPLESSVTQPVPGGVTAPPELVHVGNAAHTAQNQVAYTFIGAQFSGSSIEAIAADIDSEFQLDK